MKKLSSYRSHSSYRPALSPFLYDLTAASQSFPPEIVLPEQFHGIPAHADSSRGEAALMRAVLEDAIHCLQKSGGRKALRLAREAEQWLFADDHHWPFSFVNICAGLGLDVEYVRSGLKCWRQNPVDDPAKGRQRGPLARRAAKLAA
jgi:hypothetical protein